MVVRMCGAPADGQKKEPFHKGKSSKSAKKKQRTHGENGSKLILRFCVHLLCVHRSVSFSGWCLVSNYFSIEARNLSMPAAPFFAEKVCAPKPIFLATLPKKPPRPWGSRGAVRRFLQIFSAIPSISLYIKVWLCYHKGQKRGPPLWAAQHWETV